jgi:phosphoserine phosphatase RsbU/P
MQAIDAQYTSSQVLRAIHHDQLYLFLGAAFVTVGIVSAAFSLPRRKLDPLLLWLALFAVLYGGRLWLDTDMVRLELPHTALFLNFVVAITYLIPIPAFFFFDAAGFTGRWAKISIYPATAIFLALFAGTMVMGRRAIFDNTNNALVIAGAIVLVGRSIVRRDATRDFIVIRRGLLVFAAFVICGNLSDTFGYHQRVEQYGFAVFLGCLGYVAARRTVERDAQLGVIQKELEVARRIQLSILPSAFPSSTSFRVAARYVPMTSVAGDFYDFLLGDDRQAGLLIADVSGHGVPAALIASMVKMAATSQRGLVADPAGLLSGMNSTLLGNTQHQFVTAAYVYLDSETGELRYSAAGHPPMLILRSGEVTAVEENGLMLAAFSFATYLNAVSSLEPGDRILLYTDGILEASNAGREEFGKERLQALLRQCGSLSHNETADRIMSTVQGWAVTQEDDLTVLVCDYAPSVP